MQFCIWRVSSDFTLFQVACFKLPAVTCQVETVHSLCCVLLAKWLEPVCRLTLKSLCCTDTSGGNEGRKQRALRATQQAFSFRKVCADLTLPARQHRSARAAVDRHDWVQSCASIAMCLFLPPDTTCPLLFSLFEEMSGYELSLSALHCIFCRLHSCHTVFFFPSWCKDVASNTQH